MYIFPYKFLDCFRLRLRSVCSASSAKAKPEAIQRIFIRLCVIKEFHVPFQIMEVKKSEASTNAQNQKVPLKFIIEGAEYETCCQYALCRYDVCKCASAYW
jgi:hypothetical protein